MSRITVIGAGNGGVTAAYHLAKLGNEVCIYDSPAFDGQIRAVKEKGGIEALETGRGGDTYLFGGFEQIAMASSKGSSQPRDQTDISFIPCIVRGVLYH